LCTLNNSFAGFFKTEKGEIEVVEQETYKPESMNKKAVELIIEDEVKVPEMKVEESTKDNLQIKKTDINQKGFNLDLNDAEKYDDEFEKF